MSDSNRCPCGQIHDDLLDIEIQPTNGFESHLFIALDRSTPRGAAWPKVGLWSCRACATIYAKVKP